MKKIDIDNLKKENIYRLPENFFGNMQSEVFSKIKEPQTPIYHLENRKNPFRKYALAAAITLLLAGITTWMMLGSTDNRDNHIVTTDTKEFNNYTEETTQNTIVETEKTPVIMAENTAKESMSTPLKQENLTPQKEENSSPKKTQISDENIENMLSVYSQNELAILSQEAENDIYLDLFH